MKPEAGTKKQVHTRYPQKRKKNGSAPDKKKKVVRKRPTALTKYIEAQKRKRLGLVADRPAESNNHREHVQSLSQECLIGDSRFWSRLEIRGPFYEKDLPKEVIKNRPLFNLYRLICHRIHVNCVEFLREAPKLIGRLNASSAVKLMTKMAQSVLWITENGRRYAFHAPTMMRILMRLFKEPEILVSLDRHPVVLSSIGSLCQIGGVAATQDQLEMVRDGLMRTFYFMATDLVVFLLSTSLHDGTVIIRGHRKCTVLPNTSFYTQPNFSPLYPILTDLSLLHSDLFTRRSTSWSLWTSMPFEEADHLLLHVLEYGLLQLLPERVKVFLNEWIDRVRSRMRCYLTFGNLHKNMRKCFGETKPLSCASDDDRFVTFVAMTCEIILNRSVPIFVDAWRDFVEAVIRRNHAHICTPEELLETSQRFDPAANAKLAALFSDSPSDQAMLHHTRIQLLRFVIIFACHTIRHVFTTDGTGTLTYDGQLEDDVTEFGHYGAYEKKPLIRLPTPMETPTVTFKEIAAPQPVLPLPSLPPQPPPHLMFPGAHGFPGMFPLALPRLFDSSVPPPMMPFPTPYLPQQRPSPNFPTIPLSTESHMNFARASAPSPEVTDEELRRARALRTPSESSMSLRIDDEEGAIPKKWIDAYKLTLEWNEDLKRQLARLEARYEKTCK